jgi:hypothetical protein
MLMPRSFANRNGRSGFSRWISPAPRVTNVPVTLDPLPNPCLPGSEGRPTHRRPLGRSSQRAANRLQADWTKHAKAAPFKRNDQMLEVLPIGVIVFPGSGISANLADKAKKLGIPGLEIRWQRRISAAAKFHRLDRVYRPATESFRQPA